MLDTIRFEFKLNSELHESTKDALLVHVYEQADSHNSPEVVSSLARPTIWFTIANIDVVIALKILRNIGSWFVHAGPYQLLSASIEVIEEDGDE